MRLSCGVGLSCEGRGAFRRNNNNTNNNNNNNNNPIIKAPGGRKTLVALGDRGTGGIVVAKRK